MVMMETRLSGNVQHFKTRLSVLVAEVIQCSGCQRVIHCEDGTKFANLANWRQAFKPPGQLTGDMLITKARNCAMADLAQ